MDRHPYKLPALAGFLLALGYFPLGLVVPNLVALIPMLAWIDANLDKPWRTWRNAGFAFGAVAYLLALSWMRSMLAFSFLGAFAYLGLTAIFAAGRVARRHRARMAAKANAAGRSPSCFRRFGSPSSGSRRRAISG